MGDAATMSSALIWFSLIYWGALFFANMFLMIGVSKAQSFISKIKKRKSKGALGEE